MASGPTRLDSGPDDEDLQRGFLGTAEDAVSIDSVVEVGRRFLREGAPRLVGLERIVSSSFPRTGRVGVLEPTPPMIKLVQGRMIFFFSSPACLEREGIYREVWCYRVYLPAGGRIVPLTGLTSPLAWHEG